MSELENALNHLESKIQELCFIHVKKTEREKEILQSLDLEIKKRDSLILENQKLQKNQNQVKEKVESLIQIIQKYLNLDVQITDEKLKDKKNENTNQNQQIIFGENKIEFFEN